MLMIYSEKHTWFYNRERKVKLKLKIKPQDSQIVGGGAIVKKTPERQKLDNVSFLVILYLWLHFPDPCLLADRQIIFIAG